MGLQQAEHQDGCEQMQDESNAPSGWWPVDAVVALCERGVHVPVPHMVAIAADVRPEAIAPGAVLHPQTRLQGAGTRVDTGAQVGVAGPATVIESWIGQGAVIGSLGPVTVRDSTCGPGTVLGCGVAEQAVFLGKEANDPDFTTGYGFRVRKGSLYEEDANSAQHTDTKMTLLLPWVTLGSGLNWCDVIVAGGTGPGLGQFTEIGSGTVHFNFTPRGDKASGSLLGNLAEGVFLDQPRLFVGGNSSLIGPAAIGFGAITAAGGRYAGVLGAGLHSAVPDSEPSRTAGDDFDVEIYGSVKRLYDSQLRVIGELAALEAWYAQVRLRLAKGEPDRIQLYQRAAAIVAQNRKERIAQLGGLVERLERSVRLLESRSVGDVRIAQQRALLNAWPRVESELQGARPQEQNLPGDLDQAFEAAHAQERATARREDRPWRYTAVVQALPETARSLGKTWLRGVAHTVVPQALYDQVPALPRLS